MMLSYLLPYELWIDEPLGVLPDAKMRKLFAQSLAFMPWAETYIAWAPSRTLRVNQ